ncbi:hypothetical protein PGT21_021717 [Puccinia graminis f. sp. tritici]|uniref:Uncharacterized protein n=1 Tax=Puccinia graminis f. sp. tritici TaxID=56615 RepID=A0A5B0LJH8_PUCGR|nr:hypothetical protein PGT21_021717 [Puccinia graminis f. sp. tritici]
MHHKWRVTPEPCLPQESDRPSPARHTPFTLMGLGALHILGTQAELQTCVGIQACFNPTYCLDPPRGSIAHTYEKVSPDPNPSDPVEQLQASKKTQGLKFSTPTSTNEVCMPIDK